MSYVGSDDMMLCDGPCNSMYPPDVVVPWPVAAVFKPNGRMTAEARSTFHICMDDVRALLLESRSLSPESRQLARKAARRRESPAGGRRAFLPARSLMSRRGEIRLTHAAPAVAVSHLAAPAARPSGPPVTAPAAMPVSPPPDPWAILEAELSDAAEFVDAAAYLIQLLALPRT